MRVDPWVIERLEEEERQRREEEARQSRIELPQTAPAHEPATEANPRVHILPISPADDASFDL